MTKNITAYFTSENDAESARIRLQSLRVEKLLLDHFPEDDHELTFLPILPTTTGSFSQSPGVAAVVEEDELNPVRSKDHERMTHLIECEVKEADYEKAMKIIHEANGYKASS